MKDLDREIGRSGGYAYIAFLGLGLSGFSIAQSLEHRHQIDAVDRNHPQTTQAAKLMTDGIIYTHDDKVYIDVDSLGNPSVTKAAKEENRRFEQIETEKAALENMYFETGIIDLYVPTDQTHAAGFVLGSLLTLLGKYRMQRMNANLNPRAKSHQIQTSN